ncbi:monovalent cation/H(+) antiporter subunit G [Propionibacteriaceae bacterium Y2011]|uniref:monovalent cation/H(+) antiporter subunit G n=1 Tax=Microlunatus sp. Y2014 TaxID=3418488 RepID=UPI003B48C181
MTLDEVFDLIGAVLVLLGCFLCLSAAVGLVRFPDILTRMHAATKPQTLGLLMLVTGLGVTLRQPGVIGVLFLIAVLQLLTSPVSAHMVARAGYRSHQVSNGAIATDELAEDLAKAGFILQRTESEVAELADPDDQADDGVDDDPGDAAAGPSAPPPH